MELRKELQRRRASPDLLAMKEYLELLLEEAKVQAITGKIDIVPRVQGEARAYTRIIMMFENAPEEV